MSGFLQTLAGGAVGVAAVLAAQYAPQMMEPDAPAVEAAAPEPAPAEGPFPPGTLVLTATDGACPAGWAPGGQVALITSPDYPASPAQKLSNPGITTSATAGWSSVNFFLCRRDAP